METVYRITGIIVVWGLTISLGILIGYWIAYIIFGIIKHRIYKADWFVFYVRRKTIDSEIMRKYYPITSGKARYWMLKFRLRNIKQSKKG